MNERIVPNRAAPARERKPLEIFWRAFIMRPSRSASLLAKGTVGSCRTRSVSSVRAENRASRLCPARRATAAFAAAPRRQRRLRLVEGQPLGDDCVPTAFESGDQARLQSEASKEAPVPGRDWPRDRRAATAAASCAPNPPSRFRRAPSIRAGGARCKAQSVRPVTAGSAIRHPSDC